MSCMIRHTCDSSKNVTGFVQVFTIVFLLIITVAVFSGVLALKKNYDFRTKAASGFPSGFQETQFASGLSQPTQMTFAPDGRLFVNEKGGKVRIVKNGSLLATPFLDLSSKVETFSERGLMDIAFDPSFSSNRFIYLYYTRSQSPVKNRVVRLTASSTNPDIAEANSEVVLLDEIPSDAGNHNGGSLLFGQDGKLYISTGDGGSNSANGQNLNTLAGKVLRLNSNGTIPQDNPFVGQTGRRAEIWAYGFRNPFTMAIDSVSGKIYVNDVGAGSKEEIDQLAKGGNYGWPTCEGSCSNTNFIQPVHDYGRSVGATVVGGVFYRGNLYPQSYQGDYFFGDYSSNWVRTMDATDTSMVNLFASNASEVVDFAMGPDGAVYYLLIGSGRVFRINYGTPSPTPTPSPLPSGSLTITFNDRSAGSLSGEYPSGTATWGSGAWQVSGPFGGFTTNSISYSAAGPTSATFSFVTPRRLSNIDATNGGGGASTVSIACSGNTTKQQSVAAGQTMTIPTGFTTACTTVTLSSSNGWDTNFDNLAHDSGSGGTATPSPTPTNTAPVATITAPTQGTLYNAGDTISYTGTGTDTEDGSLPNSAFSWTIVFHHDTHTHPFLGPITGQKTGSFQIPKQGESSANVWYRINLTVTDSKGLTHQVSRDVTPRTSQLTINTSPTGLEITLDGQPSTAPITVTSVRGFTRIIGTTSPQTAGGKTYNFTSWSDGGAETHSIDTPATNTTYTATFTQQATPTPTPTPTPVDKPADLNGDGKVDVKDLSIILADWNTTNPRSDINKDGRVTVTDLSFLLSNFGN